MGVGRARDVLSKQLRLAGVWSSKETTTTKKRGHLGPGRGAAARPQGSPCPHNDSCAAVPVRTRQESIAALPPSKQLWLFWAQGWENAPAIAQACAASWERLNPTWKAHRLCSRSLGSCGMRMAASRAVASSPSRNSAGSRACTSTGAAIREASYAHRCLLLWQSCTSATKRCIELPAAARRFAGRRPGQTGPPPASRHCRSCNRW